MGERFTIIDPARLPEKPILVNVSVDVKNGKTREREIGGLVEAMDYFKVPEGTLVTRGEDGVVKVEGEKIFLVPLFK